MNAGLESNASLDTDAWRSTAFRQRALATLEDAMHKNGFPGVGFGIGKSATDMEIQAYQKSRNREEYLSFVGKMVVFISEQAKKMLQQQQQQQQQQVMGMGQQQSQMGVPVLNQGPPQTQDPLGALQSLTRQPGGMNAPRGMMGNQQYPTGPGYPRPPNSRMIAQQRQQDPYMVSGSMADPMRQQSAMNQVNLSQSAMNQQYMSVPRVQQMGMPQGHPYGQYPGPMQPSPANMSMPGPGPMMSQGQSPQPMGFSPASMGQSPLTAPSPGPPMQQTGHMSDEDRIYFDKIQHMQQYQEPLRRMLIKVHNDPDKQTDRIKMENILKFLCNPSASPKLPMDKLLRCESALENIKRELDAVSSNPPPPRPGQLQFGQQLLDTLTAVVHQPNINHLMNATFGPAVEALHGSTVGPPVMTLPCVEDPEDTDSAINEDIQAEIARLPMHIRMRLDPTYPTASSTLHLVCHLESLDLPNVPPLYLDVPCDYPESSPGVHISQLYNISSSFLEKVVQYLSEDLTQLPAKHSITKLLNVWELSVRRAAHWASSENSDLLTT